MKPGIVHFIDDTPIWRHDPLKHRRLCRKDSPYDFNDMIFRLGTSRRVDTIEYAPSRRM